MITPFKFADVNNHMCSAYYDAEKDHFIVWSLESPKVLHTFDCEEVEDLLNRGIWKRIN